VTVTRFAQSPLMTTEAGIAGAARRPTSMTRASTRASARTSGSAARVRVRGPTPLVWTGARTRSGPPTPKTPAEVAGEAEVGVDRADVRDGGQVGLDIPNFEVGASALRQP
jgi:hypothetical protein